MCKLFRVAGGGEDGVAAQWKCWAGSASRRIIRWRNCIADSEDRPDLRGHDQHAAGDDRQADAGEEQNNVSRPGWLGCAGKGSLAGSPGTARDRGSVDQCGAC